MPLYEAYISWLTHLTIARAMSPRTIEQYGRHVWAFIMFLHPEVQKNLPHNFNIQHFSHQKVLGQADKKIEAYFEDEISWASTEKITQEKINHFRLTLAQSDISITTVNAYMISLRAFLQFCKKQHIPTGVNFDDIDLQKNRDRKVEFLTAEELQNIVANIGTDSVADLRDRAIILTIYSTGLRVSELANLDIRNINLDTREFAIIGKWRKVRVVYLTEWACEAIREYLEIRGDDHFPALFLKHWNLKHRAKSTEQKWISSVIPAKAGIFTDTGSKNAIIPENIRFDRFLITKMISARALKAGIVKPVSAHTIRHSFATTLLARGADLRSIQELLGHKNIATTQVYTHVTNKQLKEVHKKFHV